MKPEQLQVGEQYKMGNSFGVISEITKIEDGQVYFVVRGRNGERAPDDGTRVHTKELNEFAKMYFEFNGRAHSGPNFDIRIFD